MKPLERVYKNFPFFHRCPGRGKSKLPIDILPLGNRFGAAQEAELQPTIEINII